MNVSVISIIVGGIIGVLGLIVPSISEYFDRKSEENISKNQINADLVAKSRIKWIQDVRQHTVDFLSEYNNIKYVKYKNKEDLEQSQAYINCLKEIDFLKLYFETYSNPVTNDFNIHKELEAFYNYREFDKKSKYIKESTKVREELKEKFVEERNINERALKCLYVRNNDEKNQYIVMLLNNLRENISFTGYPITVFKDGFLNMESDLSESIWVDNLTAIIDKYVEKLNEIMGIYLKIEWDRAKTGK